MYDLGIKAKWDYENVMAFAEEKAETRGIQKGKAIGVQKGILKGIEKTQHEIALEMKLANFPIGLISKFTKLTIPEIEAIQL